MTAKLQTFSQSRKLCIVKCIPSIQHYHSMTRCRSIINATCKALFIENIHMEQTERINQMERHLERISHAVVQLSALLNEYDAVREAAQALDDYYGSDDWKEDFAADEAGLLPAGMKRGVLSEDAIWNVLEDWRELNQILLGKLKD